MTATAALRWAKPMPMAALQVALPALDSDAWDVVIDGGIGHRDYLGLDESWPSSEALMGWLRNGGLLGPHWP